jgi:hypothetical protein
MNSTIPADLLCPCGKSDTVGEFSLSRVSPLYSMELLVSTTVRSFRLCASWGIQRPIASLLICVLP